MATEQHLPAPLWRALWICRALSALALLLMAGVHLVLWLRGYREIPLLGPGFLINALGGFGLALAVTVLTGRRLTIAAATAAAFTAGALTALLISLTVGLFGVAEQLATPFVPASLVVEAAGVPVLVATSWLASLNVPVQDHEIDPDRHIGHLLDGEGHEHEPNNPVETRAADLRGRGLWRR